MEMRIERVVLETARHRIVGDLALPSEGYRSRLSDFLNRGDVTFIPLTDATISTLDGDEAVEKSRPFVAIATGHVQIAYPER